MKGDKALWISISILIGVVIMVLSLFRGIWQVVLLLAAFSAWAAWVVYCMLLPSMKQAALRRSRLKKQRQRQQEGIMSAALQQEAQAQYQTSDPILLRHVNHRISGILRSAYPEISWEWCEANPEYLAANGGTGRIKVFGLPEFTHADVTLDKSANISFNMIKSVPLSQFVPNIAEDKPVSKRKPLDPQIWYELSGRKVLEEVVSDLNSRSYASLLINEDGEICVKQDEEQVSLQQLKGFPSKLYWPRLVDVLTGNGLAAEITEQGVQVSW